jgi:hypothetical protein
VLVAAGSSRSSVSGLPSRDIAWPVRVACVLLVIAATAAQLIDFAVYDQRVRLLDMMTHRSIFGVVSLAALATAAIACAVAAMCRGPRRRDSALLAALLALLLTFRVTRPAHVLLIAFPVSALALALLWVVAPEGGARRLLREGCVVLVLAFAVQGIGGRIVSELGRGPDTWLYQLKAVAKHSGELAGWVLIAGGMTAVAADCARRRRPSEAPG